MKNLLALLLIIFLLQNPAFAQYPMPLMGGDEVPTDFINAKGKLVFSLPVGDKLIMQEELRNSSRSLGNLQMLHIFSDKTAVVKRKNSTFYLLNEKGKMVKDLGKTYSKMGPYSEGYCVAKRVSKDYKTTEFFFLDTKGNIAFDSQAFSYAQTFSEGLALAKTKESGWVYLDKTGNVSIRLNDITPGEATGARNFKDGMALINTSNASFFINRKGEIAFNLTQILAGRSVKKTNNFQSGYLHLKMKNSVLSLNEKGEKVYQLKHKGTSYYFPGGQGFTDVSEPLGVLFDSDKFHYFYVDDRREEVLLDKYQVISLISFAEQSEYLIKQEVKNTVKYWLREWDKTPIKESLKNSRGIVGQYENLVLIRHSSKNDYELFKKSGKSIYRTPVEKRTFYDLTKALEYKEKVKSFHLLRQREIPQDLSLLTNLEYLNIEENTGTEIPLALVELKNLRQLKLSDLYKIEKLPKELSNLKSLEYLEISGLESFENIEYIVENLPALKGVYAINYEFSKEFKEKMKEINPKLEFDGFTYNTIFKG